MQFCWVLVALKRNLQSPSKQRIGFVRSSVLTFSELISGYASLDPWSGATFCSVPSKGCRPLAQPTSTKVKPEGSSASRARSQVETKRAKVISEVRTSSDKAKGTPNLSATEKTTAPLQTIFGNALSNGVQVCSQWWISCFAKRGEVIRNLDFPLRNIQIWVLAYQKLHSQVTGEIADRETLSHKITPQIGKLVGAVLLGNYKWGDTGRIYLVSPEKDIPKVANSKTKILPSSTFQDSVVQEVLLLVLEPIFEARFSARSHAFRPGRDAHTALNLIRRSFPGCIWYIQGDASILHEEAMGIRVLDSIVRVVRDQRVIELIKSSLFTQPVAIEAKDAKTGNSKMANTALKDFSKWGLCDRLIPLFCNIFLDQLDRWMDERIHSLSIKAQEMAKRSSNFLFKPAAVSLEKSCRMEYVRYGTQFLIGSNTSQGEVEQFKSALLTFLRQRLVLNLDMHLTVSHISIGVAFLDHVLSQRVVHPVVLKRRTSNGFLMQKRALGTVLSIKASRQCCFMHLQKIDSPTSAQQIKELLKVLNNWYCYAENRRQIIQHCKFILCFAYAKRVLRKYKDLMAVQNPRKFFQNAMKMIDEKIVIHDLDKVCPILQGEDWVPEHEKFLRNTSWMCNQEILSQRAQALVKTEEISPQENMSRLVWQFIRGFYPIKGDYCLEPEIQMQAHQWSLDCKTEELASSSG